MLKFSYMSHRFPNQLRAGLAVLAASVTLATVARAQAPRTFPFRATDYQVEVLLQPESQTISGLAKVEFIAQQPSRTVVVELHQDLRIDSIAGPGSKSLPFERDNNNPLILTVGLPDVVAPGKTVTLTFNYTGPLSNEDDSPTRGVRFASVDKTGAYLLLPARWFPLTNYPSNRYTGTFKITVPDNFAVVGTGKADPPNLMPGIGKGAPGQASYVFHCPHAAPVGTFVAGTLQLSPVQTEGFNVSVFTPPAQANTANSYATSLAHIYSYFSDAFGPAGNERGRSTADDRATARWNPPWVCRARIDAHQRPPMGPQSQRPFTFTIGRRTVVGRSSAARERFRRLAHRWPFTIRRGDVRRASGRHRRLAQGARRFRRRRADVRRHRTHFAGRSLADVFQRVSLRRRG